MCIRDRTGSEEPEIQRRITMANKAYFALLPSLRSGDVHRKTKMKIYKTVIRPVLCYGCEAWTITQKTADIVHTFERKILRRIIGPIQENGSWRLRYNNELCQIYKEIPVSKCIRM